MFVVNKSAQPKPKKGTKKKTDELQPTISNVFQNSPKKRKAEEMSSVEITRGSEKVANDLTRDQMERIEQNKLAAQKKLLEKRRANILNAITEGLSESWKTLIGEEFEKKYFLQILDFLQQEQAAGHHIFPPAKNILESLNLCPFDSLKVVILDPYHGLGQAHGLAFSVKEGVKVPPSLVNIYKELETDIEGFESPKHGCLSKWSQEGVLLLNTSLTVRAHEPNSHSGKGWEQFTDAIIRKISKEKSGVVFLLWGKNAQAKSELVDRAKHHVLTSAHPSPYSADRFFGCAHFSKANHLLESGGNSPIDWTSICKA